MGFADLRQNYFALFGIPEAFDIDLGRLTERYRSLQVQTHPDRYAAASDVERRISIQQSAIINDAYQTLKQPLSRARHLLELRGGKLDDTDTAMDSGFLMQQMELRETLDLVRQSRDESRLRDLQREIAEAIAGIERQIADLFARTGETDLACVTDRIRRLQFLGRLGGEVMSLEDDWSQD